MCLVVTSSYFTRLPPNHIRLGISVGTPKSFTVKPPSLSSLAPWSAFRKSKNDGHYRDLYFTQLSKLDAVDVLSRIDDLVGEGNVAVLCCYESPTKDEAWCHRGYVSQWFAEEVGVVVPELGLDPNLFGASHPKIPKDFRV